MTFVNLLNPHGSDETIIICIISSRANDFLTHTVQMKQIISKSKEFVSSIFLTHTVQMKPIEKRWSMFDKVSS